MVEGGTLPYKHAIVAYSTAKVGLPSQIAQGNWQKHSPWHHHLRALSTSLYNNTLYI